MKVTVVGGKGFIGGAVSQLLQDKGFPVYVPEKDAPALFAEDLGVVIYGAGHGDCAKNPFKVYEANTNLLVKILETSRFDKMIYLSSTRLYINSSSAKETDDLKIGSHDPRRLFNLTKILSEELCQKANRDIIVLRPSNIYGPAIDSPLFLPMIVKNALKNGRIDMFVPPDYAKDYLSVDDLSEIILHFVETEWKGFDIYNVASGTNVRAKDIAEIIKRRTDCEVVWHPGFSGEHFPTTQIEKLKQRLPFSPSPLLSDLDKMIEQFSQILNIPLKGKK